MRIPQCFVGSVTMFVLMASSLPTFAAVLTAAQVAQPSDNVNGTTHASHSATPVNAAEQFTQAVSIAKKGDTDQAFQIAKETKQIATPDRFMSVNYLNTLVDIASQKDKKLDNVILNEAIQEVNRVRATKTCRGDQDPEIAYHFMVATGRLAGELLPRSEQIAGKLMLEEGEIARNLKTNPAYPKESLASLSEPVFHKAQAHAIEGEQAEALATLQEAFELGFVKFDLVTADKHLAKLDDRARLTAMTDQARDAYEQKTRIWSKKVVRQFKRFPFQLDVRSFGRNRITQDDFRGKILVIDLWATWCSPCRDGIPHFIELQNEMSDEGVQVVGVSMDNPEDPASARDTVKTFCRENGFNYPCGLGDASVTKQLPGKTLLPTTLFVDRAGNVRYIATGFHDAIQLAALAQVLADESEIISTHHRVD